MGWTEYEMNLLFTGTLQSSSHKEKYQFKCDLCGFSHFSKYDIRRHLDDHVIQSRKTLAKTDIFSKPINSQKQYSCDICSAKFNQLGYVRYHIDIHINESPHRCGKKLYQSVCPARFTQVSALKKHGLLHSGEKRHHCK